MRRNPIGVRLRLPASKFRPTCLIPAGLITELLWACVGASLCVVGAAQTVTHAAKAGNDLASVQALINAVHAPDARALASAFGINPESVSDTSLDPASNSLQLLGDLDGDGVPELALNRVRTAASTTASGSNSAGLELFLLAWGGARWRASLVKEGAEPYEVRVVSSLVPGSRQIVVVTYGARAVPSPTIYQVKDHAAVLLWDSGAENSQYQGYADGQIEFRPANGGGPPEMVVTGRADPGLIRFPKGSNRGFAARSIYTWDGKAYLPGTAEYSDNQDSRLYQFIAALHLHDFRSAYALIDPAKFLKTDAPSLEIFRKLMEGSWPEFLDDQIFEARPAAPSATRDFAFELDSDDTHYVYLPSFSADSKRLLTGLERREEKGEAVSR